MSGMQHDCNTVMAQMAHADWLSGLSTAGRKFLYVQITTEACCF